MTSPATTAWPREQKKPVVVAAVAETAASGAKPVSGATSGPVAAKGAWGGQSKTAAQIVANGSSSSSQQPQSQKSGQAATKGGQAVDEKAKKRSVSAQPQQKQQQSQPPKEKENAKLSRKSSTASNGSSKPALQFGSVSANVAPSKLPAVRSYASVTQPAAKPVAEKAAAVPQSVVENIMSGKVGHATVKFGSFDSTASSDSSLAQRKSSHQQDAKQPPLIPRAKSPVKQTQSLSKRGSQQSEQAAELKEPLSRSSKSPERNGAESTQSSSQQNLKTQPQLTQQSRPFSSPNAGGAPMNPSANNFAPKMPRFYPGGPPTMYYVPQGGMMPYAQFPPQFQPSFAPFPGPPSQMRPPPTKMMMDSKPYPSAQPPPVADKDKDATPLVAKKPKSKGIVIKNPDTLEELKLPAKVPSTSSITASRASVSSQDDQGKAVDEPQEKTVIVSDDEPKEYDSKSPAADVKPKAHKVKSEADEQTTVKAEGAAKLADGKKDASTDKSPAIENQKQLDEKANKVANKPKVPVVTEAAKVEQKKGKSEFEEVAIQAATKYVPKAPKAFEPEAEISKESRVYDIDFILSFKDKYTQRPADLPAMEAFLGEDARDFRGGKGGSAGRRASERNSADISRQPDMRSSRNGPPSRMSSTTSKLPPGLNVRPPPPSSNRRSSQFGGGRGGYSRNSTNDRQPVRSNLPDLQKAENRWMPSSIVGAGQLEANEVINRKARSLLNKLTVEKFLQVSDQILDLEFDNSELLQSLISLIFDKATDESKYAEMYSRLCLRLFSKLRPFPEEYVKQVLADNPEIKRESVEARVLFRKFLLVQCQTEFQKRAEWANAEPLNITDDMTKEAMAIAAAEENKRRKAKRRTLGNVKFVGELFKAGILSESIIHQCITELLKNVSTPEEEEVECVGDLFITVGKVIDSEKAAQRMQEYFQRLKKLRNLESLSSRVRFKIQDVLELRERKWKPRADVNMIHTGPMKLSEAREVAEVTDQTSRGGPPSRFGGGGGSGGRRDERRRDDRDRRDDRRNQQDVRRQPSAPTSLAQSQDKSGSTGKVSGARFGPKSRGVTPAVATQRALSSESVDASKNGGNMYDMLDSAEDVSAPASADQSVDQSIENVNNDEDAAANGESLVHDLPKDLKDDPRKWIQKEIKKAFQLAAEDSFAAAFRLIVELRSYTKDSDVEATTVYAIEYLIENLASMSKKFDENKSARSVTEAIGYSVCMLISNQLVPQQLIVDSIKNQLSILVDMEMDAPGFSGTMGVVLSMMVVEQYITMQEIKELSAEHIRNAYQYTPNYAKLRVGAVMADPAYAQMFGHLVESLMQMKDRDVARELVLSTLDQSGGDWSKMSGKDLLQPYWGVNEAEVKVLPENVTQDWLAKYQLTALFED